MKLHLGCGGKLKEGWINMDITPMSGVTVHDLRKPLPYKDGEVSEIYSEHFIEHITLPEAYNLIRECLRVLCGGGKIRLSTPDLDEMMACYNNDNVKRWEIMGWVPETKCQLMNEGMRLWGHQFIYNEVELLTLLNRVGFREVERVKHDPAYESRPYCNDLIMRGIK